jgi:hypothetical protein
MIYKNNNILNLPEKTKAYNYFGDVNNIQIEMQFKDFVEDDYIAAFEKAFIGVTRPEEENSIDEKKRKIRHLKSTKREKIYEPEFKDRPVCNYDSINEATYVCLNCLQYWCEHCIKFEVHQKDLIEIKNIDNALKFRRGILLKELESKVTNDQHFEKLEKIDFLLNEKVSIVDKQFEEMISIIQRIKENQMKYLIDYFYQKLNEKKFKTLNRDAQFFINTMKDLDINYNPKEIMHSYRLLYMMRRLVYNYEDFGKVMFFDENSEIYKKLIDIRINGCGTLEEAKEIMNKISIQIKSIINMFWENENKCKYNISNKTEKIIQEYIYKIVRNYIIQNEFKIIE